MLYLFLTTHSLQIGLAHTAWTGRFQTDPRLQISAIILPISSSSTQRYLVPAEKNNLIVLHNFADLLAAFISVDLNITVMFYKLLKYKLQRRHSIFLGDCQWCLMKKFGYWTSWDVFNKIHLFKNVQRAIFSNLLSCTYMKH